MTDASTTRRTATQGESEFGLLQIGAARVALSLDALREVIPCPPAFGSLPAAATGLLGAIGLRGRVVPVLDLRVVLGLPAERAEGQVVVVARHANRTLGLLVDGVRGLTRLATAAVHDIRCEGGTLLFTGSFQHETDGTVVSVLDPGAVMSLPGVPLLQDDGDAGKDARRNATTEHKPLMLVRCGEIGLAIDVTDIHATLPRVEPRSSSLEGRVCRGVIEHAGACIAAVDPLALMELGTLPAGQDCQALLLKFDGGFVAILVNRVIDIVRVAEAELRPLPPLAVRRPEFFRAALRAAGHGEQLVLGAQVLRNEAQLIALASLNTRSSGAGAGTGRAAPTATTRTAATHGTAVITYELDVEVATQLTQVIEVLPLPADYARPAGTHPAVMGLFSYRGEAATLVCLTSLLGGRARPDPAHARVLLVSVPQGQFGFVVPRLCRIENTVWEAARLSGGTDRPAATVEHPLRRHAVVELGEAAQRRTLQLIDLLALAGSLIDGPATPTDRSADAPAQTKATA